MEKIKYRIRVVFTPEWVLTRRNDDILPVDFVVRTLNEKFITADTHSDLTSIDAVIDASGADTMQVIEELRNLIITNYDIDSPDAVFTVAMEETVVQEAEDNKKIPESSPVKSAVREVKKLIPGRNDGKADAKPVLERINELIGAEEFKALAKECADLSEGFRQNNIADAFRSRAYLISINEGYGLTTYLELFADLLKELQLFEFGSSSKTVEVKLGPTDKEDSFDRALQYFQGRPNGKVVCIDISEWMTKNYEKKFRLFLKRIYENSGNNIVFFRVPFVENNILQELHAAINDLLFVKTISVVPFSVNELKDCAEQILRRKDFTLDDGAWEIFNCRLIEEKNDGRFYGINTIEKVINEMLYRKQMSDFSKGCFDRKIVRSDIAELVADSSSALSSGLEQLNALVGMDEVRSRVFEVVAQIEAASKNADMETPCIHMRFVGSPGTGKTTVARILGKILKEKGILRNGDFFEYSGRDLCGRYVGETAPKTASICRDSYGSVLFIDEAYSLYRSESSSHADYGKEAIDTLIAEMENHRTDFMVIMAGYSDEMETLMKSNAGLKSRMPYTIEFPNYSREDLAAMFMAMTRKSFKAGEGLEEAVTEYFASLTDEIIEAKDFSNARYVRNLFERTWGKAVLRCQMSNSSCSELTIDDFALASSEKEFKSIAKDKKKPIGFI